MQSTGWGGGGAGAGETGDQASCPHSAAPRSRCLPSRAHLLQPRVLQTAPRRARQQPARGHRHGWQAALSRGQGMRVARQERCWLPVPNTCPPAWGGLEGGTELGGSAWGYAGERGQVRGQPPGTGAAGDKGKLRARLGEVSG